MSSSLTRDLPSSEERLDIDATKRKFEELEGARSTVKRARALEPALARARAPLRVLSLFTGIGAFEAAMDGLGMAYELVGFAEIEPNAVGIYTYHYPTTRALGSVTAIDWASLGDVDLIVGGPPCQGLSHANPNALGLADERSALMLVFIEAVRVLRPRYFICENVASMRKTWRDLIDAHFAEIGGLPGVTIDGAYVGLQSRKRIFWANFPITEPRVESAQRFADVLLPPDEVAHLAHSDKALAYMNASPDLPERRRRLTRYELGHHHDTAMSRARTIPRNITRGVPYNVLIDRRFAPPLVRKLHPIEVERLFGFPDNWTARRRVAPTKRNRTGVALVTDGRRLAALGNSIMVPMAEHVLRHLLAVDGQ